MDEWTSPKAGQLIDRRLLAAIVTENHLRFVISGHIACKRLVVNVCKFRIHVYQIKRYAHHYRTYGSDLEARRTETYERDFDKLSCGCSGFNGLAAD